MSRPEQNFDRQAKRSVESLALVTIASMALAGVVGTDYVKKIFFNSKPTVAGCKITDPGYLRGSNEQFTEFGFASQLAQNNVNPTDIELDIDGINLNMTPPNEWQPGITTIKVPEQYCEQTIKLYPNQAERLHHHNG